MANKNSRPTRVDADFEDEMRKLAKIRLDRGLAKFNPRDLSTAEMTRLLRRTTGYKLSIEEMKTKPKKENLR